MIINERSKKPGGRYVNRAITRRHIEPYYSLIAGSAGYKPHLAIRIMGNDGRTYVVALDAEDLDVLRIAHANQHSEFNQERK